MAQRRRRYTVTMQDGSKQVVLAYRADGADDYFRSRGYAILKVALGDYRAASTPSGPSGGRTWRKNEAAIREAIEFLGITKPISIKVTSRRGGRRGAHQLRGVNSRDQFFRRGVVKDFAVAADVGHYITVKAWCDVALAGRTIWHELCHAMQAEAVIAGMPAPVSPREAYDAWCTCEAAGRGVTYMRKPIEVEAREYEKFNDEMPLAR